MGSVKDYFKSLGTGVLSLLKGMQVTGKEFITPKITERYPEDRETRHVPERFRALLQLKYDDKGFCKCTACGTCERNCPNGTITLETKMVDTWKGKKKKLDKYIYDLGSCTFCDLCVTTCPFDALEFTNDFEQAVFTRSKLVKQLNDRPEPPEPEPTPEELAAYKAQQEKIAAAKAAAAKAAAAKAAAAKAENESPAAAVKDEKPDNTEDTKIVGKPDEETKTPSADAPSAPTA